MGFLFALITTSMLMLPHGKQNHVVHLDCPENTEHEGVCVFTDTNGIIAINPTENPVKIVVQIQRIENVELVYRYPFIEVLPPRSSRTLINYKIVLEERPHALDYDWGWLKI
jgi:hypothetical protein